jgi:Fe-S-cluster containining protein
VSGDDYERLGDNVEQLVRFDGVRAHMRMRDGHCAALRFEPDSGQLSCSVYALRPKICRDLARGSPQCAAEREVKAERPLLALRRATPS